MRRMSLISIIGASLLILAGCGYNRGDRALSGAAIGAGAGAAGGAIAGHPAEGAAIGAGAGAATGALTSPNDVNLGRPAWR